MKLLIIADDFTGAMDTGVQLSKNNISTCVLTDSDNIPSPFPDCEVAVINSNTRHYTPTEAYNNIQNILKKLYFNDLYVYIKTDSVFRGNISAVFAGAINYIKKPLFFVPAYPELNRTTKAATAYVDGKLLENSVFAKDPRTPATQSNIPSIINRDYSLNVNCISWDNYDKIKKSELKPDNIYLFDCENNEQLDSIGELANSVDGYRFCSGCAGFAATFVTHLPLSTDAPDANRDVNNQPTLFINGSANAVTFAQLTYAKKCNYPVYCLSSQLDSYINSSQPKTFMDIPKDSSFQRVANEVSAHLNRSNSVILATATENSELLDFKKLHLAGKNDEQIHNCIAEYTSNLVKSILETTPLSNIVVFGGDMAYAILQSLGICEVWAGGEITPGVPVCHIEKDNRTINFVTKSGGFGSDTLIPVIENYFMKG